MSIANRPCGGCPNSSVDCGGCDDEYITTPAVSGSCHPPNCAENRAPVSYTVTLSEARITNNSSGNYWTLTGGPITVALFTSEFPNSDPILGDGVFCHYLIFNPGVTLKRYDADDNLLSTESIDYVAVAIRTYGALGGLLYGSRAWLHVSFGNKVTVAGEVGFETYEDDFGEHVAANCLLAGTDVDADTFVFLGALSIGTHTVVGISVSPGGEVSYSTSGDPITNSDCSSTVSWSGIGSVTKYPNGHILTGGDGVSAGSGKITTATQTPAENASIAEVEMALGPDDLVEFEFNSPTDGDSIKAIVDTRPGTYSGESYDLEFGFTSVQGTTVAQADRVRVKTYGTELYGVRVQICLLEKDKLVMRIAGPGFRDRCVEYIGYGTHPTDWKFSVDCQEGTVKVYSISLKKHGLNAADSVGTEGCTYCSGCTETSEDPDCVLCRTTDCNWDVVQGNWEVADPLINNSGTGDTILTPDTAGSHTDRMLRCQMYLPQGSTANAHMVLGWVSSSKYLFAGVRENNGCLYMYLGYENSGTTYEHSYGGYAIGYSDNEPFGVVAQRIWNGTSDELTIHIPKFNAYLTWDTGTDLFASSGHDRIGFRMFFSNTQLGRAEFRNARVITPYDDTDNDTWDCPRIGSQPDCVTTNDCCDVCYQGTWPSSILAIVPEPTGGPDVCCTNGDTSMAGRYVLYPKNTEGTQNDMCTYRGVFSSDTICSGAITIEVTLVQGDEWNLKMWASGVGNIDWDSNANGGAQDWPVNCYWFAEHCSGTWVNGTNSLSPKCTFSNPPRISAR